MKKNINASREAYLLCIYSLSKNGDKVSAAEISRMLEISRASVSEMLKKLEEDRYIEFSGRAIGLTEKGKKIAEDLRGSHRLWEIFMIDYLNIDYENAHEQADLLEHVTGSILKSALNRFLNFPNKDIKGYMSCPCEDMEEGLLKKG